MPDILLIISRKWKLIAGLTLTATVLALVVALLRPKEYLATVTALPANSAITDKARLLNRNVEGLYAELGSPDELDRIEGTAGLDTIFIAAAATYNLAAYYKIDTPYAVYKAAKRLKNNTDIHRSAYGELKIKVWDKDPDLAARLANAILENINGLQRYVVKANNLQLLAFLKTAVTRRAKALDSLQSNVVGFETSAAINKKMVWDTLMKKRSGNPFLIKEQQLIKEINEYQQVISDVELAIETTPNALVVVENARPAYRADRPKILRLVVITFFASLLFSFLLALFAQSRTNR